MPMRLPVLGSAAVLAGLSVVSGCSGAPESVTITQAERLTLYEGLPHQYYETASLEAEKKAKPTITMHGFPFYRETLELTMGDELKLKALLGNGRLFEPHTVDAKCGGFHPDYAVEWLAGGQTYQCLICLGCGEVATHGSTNGSHYDIKRDTRERLKEILGPLRKNRPPHDFFGPGSPA
jgi:hypothetical protein